MRIDGRDPDQLRPIQFELDYISYPEGSVLMEMGQTRLLCNVTVDEKTPAWFGSRAGGWITAEYAMLPRSTHSRMKREILRRRGRSQEIQRLIGRSLRAGFELEHLGNRTFIVDCDVLQADGGTRTAAISAGYLALRLAMRRLDDIQPQAFRPPIAAVSAGMVEGQALLDLCYEEDSQAESDLNGVMNGDLELIELQATAEREAIKRDELEALLALMRAGIRDILSLQEAALARGE